MLVITNRSMYARCTFHTPMDRAARPRSIEIEEPLRPDHGEEERNAQRDQAVPPDGCGPVLADLVDDDLALDGQQVRLDIGLEESAQEAHDGSPRERGEEASDRLEGTEEGVHGLSRRLRSCEQIEQHERDDEHQQDLLDPITPRLSSSRSSTPSLHGTRAPSPARRAGNRTADPARTYLTPPSAARTRVGSWSHGKF